MSFAADLDAARFPVALEITPPQKRLPRVLVRRASLLGTLPTAINVIQRAGRQSSLDASRDLLAAGIAPAWHLATRGQSRADLLAGLAEAAAAGISQVLCIRGDHDAPDAAGAPTIRETVALVREHLPGALVGATLNQYAPDAEAAIRNLLPKLRAGARYVQTQPVFDVAGLLPFAARATGETGAHIVAMVMPLLSLEAAEKIQARLGFGLPPGLRQRLQQGPEGGWAVFERLLEQIVQSGAVHGVAVMTFEMDPPPEVGERVAAILRRTLPS